MNTVILGIMLIISKPRMKIRIVAVAFRLKGLDQAKTIKAIPIISLNGDIFNFFISFYWVSNKIIEYEEDLFSKQQQGKDKRG